MSLVAVLALAGCAATPSSSPTPAPGPPTPSGSTSPQPGSQLAIDCGTAPAAAPVKDLTLPASDGVRLSAAVLGEGRRGVVLLHQTDNGKCGWLAYGSYLATRGYHVLIFDRRCQGQSTCPAEETKAYAHAADVKTVVAALRREGAQKVAVVGASFGGAVALGACSRVEVAACAALSPALFDTKLGAGLTANTGITALRVPTLVADAPDDPDSPLDTVSALVRRAQPGVVTLVRLPAGAGHGWDTVSGADDQSPAATFSDRLISFLEEHLR